MQGDQLQQYRVVRDTAENDQRGTSVIADSPQAAVWAARDIAERERWPGTASAWIVYQDTRQWHPVYSEAEPI
jgi:hypothetical protein